MENNDIKITEVKPEASQRQQAEPKIEPKAEPKPEQKVEPKAEPKPEQKVEPKAEPKPKQKVEPKAEPNPEAKTEPKKEEKAPAPAKNIQKIDYSKRTRSYKAHKIISTIICAVVTIALLVFFIPLLVDVLTTVPDPEAQVDLSGLGNALYAVFALVGAIIALVFYIPSTTLGAIAFVGTLKRYKGKEKIGEKIWFGILTFLPLLIEILLLLSILLVV